MFYIFYVEQLSSKSRFFSRRLVGAIEVHLSLGGLSRRQLLQMTFISIVNLYRAGMNSGGSVTSLLNFVLSFLDLLIRPPVDPSRHLPSVLSILQFFDQNIDLIRDNRVSIFWVYGHKPIFSLTHIQFDPKI